LQVKLAYSGGQKHRRQIADVTNRRETVLLAAQQPVPSSPAAGPQSPQWQKLSVKEKLRYDWRHLFDVDNVAFAGIGASFDQWRDRPGEWREGWGPFAGRYASHLGQYAVQRSIMFPVQAMDGEDTRYFRSAGPAAKDALATSFCTPSGAITTVGR
jgi:hypothetical protein